MKAELTAENNPAYVPPDSVFGKDNRNKTTNKDKGRVQLVLVVLFRVIAVKFTRLPMVDGEEVGSRIVGPQWFEELFEGGMETKPVYQRWSHRKLIETIGFTISNLPG